MHIKGLDILEKIGEGATATVWRAYQTALDRYVAVKVLKKEWASRDNEIKIFLENARLAAKLKHPSIIQIYDVGESEGFYFFVMEHINGVMLSKVLLNNTPLPSSKVMAIIISIAEALEYAWNTVNLPHLGLKPSNIYIEKDGSIKIGDFGMARALAPSNLLPKIQNRCVTVTTNYCSPEQATCTVNPTFKTDIYSLGALMYHMLTAKMPFAPATPTETLEKHQNATLKSPKELVPGISVAIEDIMIRMMMKSADDRYNSWGELIADLKKSAGGKIFSSKNMVKGRSTIEKMVVVAQHNVDPRTKQLNQKSKTVNNEIPFIVKLFTYGIVIVLLTLYSYLEWSKNIRNQTVKNSISAPVQPAKYHETHISSPVSSSYPTVAPINKSQQVEQKEMSLTTTTTTITEKIEDTKAFKREIVDFIIKNGFRAAVALIEQDLQYNHTPEYENELERWKTFLESAVQSEDYIIGALRSKIGREITIRFSGQNIRIVPTAVSENILEGNTIVVMPSGASGSKKITIEISKLEPQTKIELLGTADTPAKAALKWLWYVQAREFNAARQFAASSEPFADIFMEYTEINKKHAY